MGPASSADLLKARVKGGRLEAGLICAVGLTACSWSLHVAAEHGHTERVLALLDQGTEVNQLDPNGLTALHYAAAEGHLDTVRALLERGADVNGRGDHTATPLHYAANNGHFEVVRLLVDRGAEVKRRPRGLLFRGKSAAEVAEWKGHLEFARYLREAEARAN